MDSTLTKATTILLSNYPPKPVDALFFYGRSFGDETGLFELAASMFHQGTVKFIAIVNSDGQRLGSDIPFQAHIGKDEFRRRLIELDIPDDKIICPDLPGYHTRQETDAFLDLAKKQGWTSAVNLNQPHQVLRTMLGTLKSLEQLNYGMEIYAASPSFVLWQEVVKGSQGLEAKTREEHIAEELSRIPTYQEKGDICSFEELFVYLKVRESGTLKLGPS